MRRYITGNQNNHINVKILWDMVFGPILWMINKSCWCAYRFKDIHFENEVHTKALYTHNACTYLWDFYSDVPVSRALIEAYNHLCLLIRIYNSELLSYPTPCIQFYISLGSILRDIMNGLCIRKSNQHIYWWLFNIHSFWVHTGDSAFAWQTEDQDITRVEGGLFYWQITIKIIITIHWKCV